ncbi:MAG: CBS domain-containing protein [Candidatus Thermoplasmatota archaeon]|nr:CBS domain-containing protein [Candidatus Thermoplasmatota archaeon]
MRIDSLRLGDIMSRAPITVGVDERVSDAIAKMKKHRVRELPVVKDKTPVGLVSYTSFVERRSVPMAAKVDSIMLPVPKLRQQDGLIDAAEALVATGIRGAPVVQGGKMIGFVSRTDLIRTIGDSDELRRRQVRDFMTREPKSVGPDEIVRKAQIVMEGLNEKALPVVDDGNRLVGVIGMPEIIDVLWKPKADMPLRSPKPPRKVYDSRVRTEIKVGSVMTREVVTVSPEDTIGTVSGLMLHKGISTVFVSDDGKLVGVVDQSDLMEQLISLRPRDGVFVQISGIGLHAPDAYDGLYDLIGKGMKRVAKMERPRVFYVHITAYDDAGLTSKYSVRARLSTEKNMYYVRNSDWSIYRAMSDLLESLEGKIRKQRERTLSGRRQRSPSIGPSSR